MACLDHNEFGPATRCRDFDFTIGFETIFFVLAPSILVLPLFALRIWRISSRPPAMGWLAPLVAKLVLYIALAALQLAGLCIYAQRDGDAQSRLNLPAAALLLVATVGLAALSVLEHSRSPKPAFLIQAYLLLTLLLDAVRIRSQWLIPGEPVVASLQSASLVAKFAVLVIESIPKGSHLTLPADTVLSPEAKAGFFSSSLMLWLIPLFVDGYRTKLSLDDLYPIDSELCSEELLETVHAAWVRTRPNRKRRLAIALAKAFIGQLLMIQLPRLALVGFAIAQPFLVQAALSYIAHHAVLPVSFGYGLIGATGLVYIGVAISTLWYQHLTYRLLTMIRGALIGMVFRHSLTLPASESSGSSGAVSLLGTDIERIQQTLQWVLNIVPNLVQVGIALWVLSTFLGAVFVAPLIVAVACGFMATQVGKRIPKRQIRWMKAIQKRVGVTTDAIGYIKGVKMSGLSDRVAEQIQGLRAAEMDDQRAFRRLQIANIALGNAPGMLTPAATFAAFAIAQSVGSGDQFQVATAFTSLALLSILINPVAELVSATTNLTSALSCLDRIQQFLDKTPQPDSRSLPPDTRSTGSIPSSHDATGMELVAVGNRAVQRQAGSESEFSHSPLVRITNGTFGWEADKPIIRGVNLEVLPSQLIMAIGPVGVGKSTLLRSLLGETRILAGTIECASPKQIAYCDQDPWIINTSIKKNILGISEYDEDRYNTIIEACQLKDDFEQLPDGDETSGGSKGLSLSGGQKQRISLARTAYSGKQLIILDDTFSGLDANTSLKSFGALLGDGGLLRRDGRSVVLSTHNVQWLSSADEIVVLDRDGTISGKGKLEALFQANDYVRELLETQKRLGDGQVDDDLPTDGGASSVEVTAPKQLEQLAEPAQTKVEELEEEPSRPHEVKPFRHYLSAMGPGLFLGFVFLVLFQVGCSTAQPLWLKFWTAANQRSPNEGAGKWAGVYVLFALGTILFITLGTGYFFLLLVPKAARNLHRTLLDATFGAPLSFFVAKDTGVIVNIFTGDLNQIDLPLPGAFILTTERALSTLSEVLLTSLASGYLALAIPPLAALLLLLQRIYLRTSRQLRVLDLEAKAPLFSHAIATAAGLVTLRAFAWAAAAEAQNARLLDAAQRPHYLLFCLQRWLVLVLDLVTAGLAALLVGLAVVLRDRMDAGYLGVAMVGVMSLGQVASALIVYWTNLETALQAVGRVQTYTATTPAEWPEGGAKGPDGGAGAEVQIPEPWPSQGEIVLSDVSVSYGGLKALDRVNLTFEAGSKIAICGRTGSGKSSLLGLLLRLYEPAEGQVAVDGVKLSAVPPSQVRSSIVALPQDPLFLVGSVRDNLDPHDEHTGHDDPLLAVLERTGLKALIEEKGGLDSVLSADWLSAGQKQLFGLARVMLRHSRVLLLDEATSHLDEHSGKLVNELIQAEFRDWTVIAVTHRLKPLADPDSPFENVVVLQEGRVIENDSPARLLNRKDGVFRGMVKMQDLDTGK